MSHHTIKHVVLIAGVLSMARGEVLSQGPNVAPITWNREISRIVLERCASCHRNDGTSFSLTTYKDAQPHAAAMKDSVLSRRMPPWGAVKGFGHFKNDQGLTQEQISLIADWVEGGISRGDDADALPPASQFERSAAFSVSSNAISVSGNLKLARAVTLDGVYPRHVPSGVSMQVVAVLPNGDIEPLIWLYEYTDNIRHPFFFRTPLELPARTSIRGVRNDATLLLVPVGRRP